MQNQHSDDTAFALRDGMFLPTSYGLFEWSQVNDNHLQLTVDVPKIPQRDEEIPVDVRPEHDDEITCLFCAEIMYDEESGLYGAWCDYGDMDFDADDLYIFDEAYQHIEQACYRELASHGGILEEHLNATFSNLEWEDISEEDWNPYIGDKTLIADRGPFRAVYTVEGDNQWTLGLELQFGQLVADPMGEVDFGHGVEPSTADLEQMLQNRSHEIALNPVVQWEELTDPMYVASTHAWKQYLDAKPYVPESVPKQFKEAKSASEHTDKLRVPASEPKAIRENPER